MPLTQSDSKKALRDNISQLVKDGYPLQQAVAIALQIQRKAKAKKKKK